MTFANLVFGTMFPVKKMLIEYDRIFL